MTTYIRGLSGYITAVFDYDLPDRTFDADVPGFYVNNQPLNFTITITSDADMTAQDESFFEAEHYYRADDGYAVGVGRVIILSKTISGNTCVMECKTDVTMKSLGSPIYFEVGLRRGVYGKEGAFRAFILMPIVKVDAVSPPDEYCTSVGNIEYWKKPDRFEIICRPAGKNRDHR
ncbi:MAG: hypothetical protein IJU75_07080 [Clostridia bacterium]|nr:hypothetical protein [Clostridia bacterium]